MYENQNALQSWFDLQQGLAGNRHLCSMPSETTKPANTGTSDDVVTRARMPKGLKPQAKEAWRAGYRAGWMRGRRSAERSPQP